MNFNLKDFLSVEALKKKIKGKIWVKIILPIAPQLAIIAGAVLLVLIAIGPIMEGVEGLKKAGSDIGTFFEKLGNWVWYGWKTNEEIFYETVDNEYNKYGELGVQLDIPLMFATITYPYAVEYDPKVSECMTKDTQDPSCEGYQGVSDSSSSVDTGKIVSGKADRVHRLAENMVNTMQAPRPTSDNPNATVTVYYLDYNKYDDYLRNDYIINMPEFKFPKDLSESEKASRLKAMIEDIHGRAKLFTELFTKKGAFASYGTISEELLKYLKLPVQEKYSIIGCFGYSIENGDANYHIGVDVVPDKEDIFIRAVADGIVTITKNDSSGKCYPNCSPEEEAGNYIEIFHELDSDKYLYSTRYLHLASISEELLKKEPVEVVNEETLTGPTYIKGIPVTQGEIIGTMGETGNAEKPHLEFQFFKGNTPLNSGNLFKNPQAVTGSNCSFFNNSDLISICRSLFMQPFRCKVDPNASTLLSDSAMFGATRYSIVNYAMQLYLRVKYCSANPNNPTKNGCHCDTTMTAGNCKDSLVYLQKQGRTCEEFKSYCNSVGYDNNANYYARIGENPKWQPNSPEFGKVGLDCGGYVAWVFHQVYNDPKPYGNSRLYLCANNQGNVKKTDDLNLKPGDILCNDTHVGLFLGYVGEKGYYIHSPGQGYGILIDSVSKSKMAAKKWLFDYFYTPGIVLANGGE